MQVSEFIQSPEFAAANAVIKAATNDAVRGQCLAFWAAGQKVWAIKIYRHHYYSTLKEAKEMVEKWAADAGLPKSF